MLLITIAIHHTFTYVAEQLLVAYRNWLGRNHEPTYLQQWQDFDEQSNEETITLEETFIIYPNEDTEHVIEADFTIANTNASRFKVPYDPEGIFANLFTEDGDLDLGLVKYGIEGRTLSEVVSWCDVDHYNLLEKAVIYNNRVLVRLLLELDEHPSRSSFSFGDSAFEESSHCFKGAIHLAAFLGCVDIIEEFLDHNEALSALRGPVHIRPVAGPENDLFRIIGYGDFTQNPRLTFQMKWLRAHPNERPVHYAICGGYPIIMDMLMIDDQEDQDEENGTETVKSDYMESASLEKDALLANLLRQAASCASYSCLTVLYQKVPEAIYMRDQRGWLYINSGFSHGTQFLKFLLEQGFALKLLNNIDGHGTVNALHVFYNSLSKSDFVTSKFTEVYDVTELMVDLGININMETTEFRSHEISDTPLHLLLDNLNLVVSSVIHDDYFPRESKLSDEVQQVYDESIRDAICLILESGYNLEKHSNSLLKRLFLNRNFIKRYKIGELEKTLLQANFGLRHMYNIAKLLLRDGGIILSPARREMTPSICLIDSLRQDLAVECILGDRRATHTFCSILSLLFQNGDNPNIYPFSSSEDSYLAIPLVHFCDLYLEYWCSNHINPKQDRTVVNIPDVLVSFCEAGAHFSCFMNHRSNYLRHGVFDQYRKLFQMIHRECQNEDQILNKKRLRVLHVITSRLVQYGARPVLEEYAFRNDNFPVLNKQVESTVLGQLLLLGLHCSLGNNENQVLVSSEEYRSCLVYHLNLADHVTYYTSLNHVITSSQSIDVHNEKTESPPLIAEFLEYASNVRTLKNLARLVIMDRIKFNVRDNVRFLSVPTKIRGFLVNFEI